MYTFIVEDKFDETLFSKPVTGEESLEELVKEFTGSDVEVNEVSSFEESCGFYDFRAYVKEEGSTSINATGYNYV